MMGTIQATVVRGYNNLHSLFNDHIKKKDEVIEQKDAALEVANSKHLPWLLGQLSASSY